MGYRRLSAFSFHRPLFVLCVWLCLLASLGSYAARLPDVLKDHGLLAQDDFVKVQNILEDSFRLPQAPVVLVFENDGAVAQSEWLEYIRLALDRVQSVRGLTQTVSPLNRAGLIDGDVAYALLGFAQPSYAMSGVIEELQSKLPQHGGIAVRLTGKTVVQNDVNRASAQDLKRAELIGIPAALIVLWAAFGGLVSALLPVLTGAAGVTVTMGVMYWIGARMELSHFVLNVVPMVGLALSIDFALMLVSRYREELARRAPEQAWQAAADTAGRAVMFSAACVVLGLAGVLLVPLPMFSTVAVGAMTVVAVSALAAVTLLPAMLSLAGRTVAAEKKRSASGRAWAGWSHYVMNRPVRMLLLSALLLFICLLPLRQMKLAIPDASSLPHGYESRKAAEAYAAHFAPPERSGVYLLTERTSADWSLNDWRRAYALVRRLESDPLVRGVDSVFSALGLKPEALYQASRKAALDPESGYASALRSYVTDNRMLIRAELEGGPGSEATMAWIRTWQRLGADPSAEFPFRLGGEAKYEQEIFDTVRSRLPRVLLYILAANYIVLYLAFRSLLLPVKAILMNIASLAGACGILVWIFQGGHFGMEPSSIAVMIPVFLFGLVFGISMDYGVFLLSRMYESYGTAGDNDAAVREGLASSGRVITSAAAILIVVTVPFALGDVVGVKQLGIGIAAAVALDATVVRLMLVPSLMKLLGRWNWWSPGRFP
ncbi:Membrane protein YdfJ [Paenibacillus konkukensis]|uniref:Membrane protein YdfJ n=1 Tax=Paenibacillus konkukensis TaxID=2020716 RepID=A0ABY4RJI4_9BACL|nr:MMPL family transporter [Paenibacillus konkukensis]UQZ82275.1 Membrane protein YdfJ [Paenibacillus konkukensis]